MSWGSTTRSSTPATRWTPPSGESTRSRRRSSSTARGTSARRRWAPGAPRTTRRRYSPSSSPRRNGRGAGDNPLTPAPLLGLTGPRGPPFTLPKTLLGAGCTEVASAVPAVSVFCELQGAAQLVGYHAVAAAPGHLIVAPPLAVVAHPVLEDTRHHEPDEGRVEEAGAALRRIAPAELGHLRVELRGDDRAGRREERARLELDPPLMAPAHATDRRVVRQGGDVEVDDGPAIAPAHRDKRVGDVL